MLNTIKIRRSIKWINLGLFILFLIIGLYTYLDNGKDIEPNIFKININHFSTFFGGSSLILTGLIFISDLLKIHSNKLTIEKFSIFLSSIATLWFTYDDEIQNIKDIKYDEIYGNLLGLVCFIIINIALYIYFIKTYNK